MSVLLIWQEVPYVSLYLLPDEVEEKYRQELTQSHNRLINDLDWENNAGLNTLNGLMYGSDTGDGKGEFEIYKVSNSTPLTENITRVYISGIFP